MIIATFANARANDRRGIMVGLSRTNIERLLAGEPIFKDAVPVSDDGGAVMSLMIFFGENEEDMHETLVREGFIDQSQPIKDFREPGNLS